MYDYRYRFFFFFERRENRHRCNISFPPHNSQRIEASTALTAHEKLLTATDMQQHQATGDRQQQNDNNNHTPHHTTPSTLFLPAQTQAHFIPSGTRLAQECLDYRSAWCEQFANQRMGDAHSGTQGKFFMYGEPTGRTTVDVWGGCVCVSRMAWVVVCKVCPCVMWCRCGVVDCLRCVVVCCVGVRCVMEAKGTEVVVVVVVMSLRRSPCVHFKTLPCVPSF